MLVCEPALLETSRSLLSLRDLMLERGYDVKAPSAEKAPAAEKALSALKAPATASKPLREISGRVVSDGMLNKAGRIRFVICTGKERITVSAKQGAPLAMQKGFFSFHRYDMVTITNPEIRGDKNNVSYGIDAGTEIIRVPFA